MRLKTEEIQNSFYFIFWLYMIVADADLAAEWTECWKKIPSPFWAMLCHQATHKVKSTSPKIFAHPSKQKSVNLPISLPFREKSQKVINNCATLNQSASGSSIIPLIILIIFVPSKNQLIILLLNPIEYKTNKNNIKLCRINTYFKIGRLSIMLFTIS